MAKWVLVIAFHFFPAVAGQTEGGDGVSQMLNSRGVLGDAMKEVEKSLEETLERMRESLAADLQVRQNLVLAGLTTKGQEFEEEVIDMLNRVD